MRRRWRRYGSRLLLLYRAPESHVSGAAVHGVAAARGDAVAIAVRSMTEIRPAANHLRLALRRAARVAPCLRALAHVKRGAPPIGAPLPYVARHVVQAVAVGSERAHRCGRKVAVVAGVDLGKAALPDVAAMLAARPQLAAPWISGPREAAA